jgi:tetratricopeptide (TPR) repeat protein
LADYLYKGLLDFGQANKEYERALALGLGNARILRNYGRFVVLMGRTEAGIAAARRAVALDPLNRWAHDTLGEALRDARQYDGAIGAFQNALALDPDDPQAYYSLGLSYYTLGDLQRARTSCERKPDNFLNQVCLAMAYDKLGRHSDAEAMLAKIKALVGNAAAYQYAQIYAQWRNAPKALEWLETALQLRDGGLAELKVDPFLDPLRREPRFQAVERKLRFPD